MTEIGVAILAGGASKRLGSQKALVNFRGKPMILHVLEKAKEISSQVRVIVSDESQIDDIANLIGEITINVDPDDSVGCALTGALTAFEYADTKYTQLLPVDAPLINTQVMKLLGSMALGHGAVVPSWPSGYIEPLHSIYHSEHAYALGLETMDQGLYRMSDLLQRLRNVLYVSTETLKQLDPKLETFTNINSLQDLKENQHKK
jgi:molybdopterin-guanine dinucleotide biosynthesis protein A